MKILNHALIVAICLMGLSFTWPDKLDKKVKSTISKTFNLENFELKAFEINDDAIDDLSGNVKYLSTILHDGEIQGYIYVGEAPSMKNVFDYAVILSPELKIINAKILIYREKHGRQIGTKRWLKQFFGMKPNEKPILGNQIDGISGATISATSMTKAVREVLETIQYLQSSNQI